VRIKNSLYRDETILVEAISLATFWMLDPGEPHPLYFNTYSIDIQKKIRDSGLRCGWTKSVRDAIL
jgi:hypothetical protein